LKRGEHLRGRLFYVFPLGRGGIAVRFLLFHIKNPQRGVGGEGGAEGAGTLMWGIVVWVSMVLKEYQKRGRGCWVRTPPTYRELEFVAKESGEWGVGSLSEE